MTAEADDEIEVTSCIQDSRGEECPFANSDFNNCNLDASVQQLMSRSEAPRDCPLRARPRRVRLSRPETA